MRLFTPPPEHFDPTKASDRELVVHGYPARPDALLHPELRAFWDRMVGRATSIVQPRFAVIEDARLRLRRVSARPAEAPSIAPVGYGGGWCGSYYPELVTWVGGQWTIPAVTVPAGSKENVDFACTTWVGFQALRLGTWQQVSLADEARAFPFYWYDPVPDIEEQLANDEEGPPPSSISNLPVSAGDVMYGLICVYSATSAGIHLLNVTTGVGTSFTVPVAAGALSDGLGEYALGAGWMLEVPNFEEGPSYLPRYGDVYFDDCVAGTPDNALVYSGGWSTYPQMVDIDNQQISVAQQETDRLFKVMYTGP